MYVMAWKQWQKDYLDDRLGKDSRKSIAAALGKTESALNVYLVYHKTIKIKQKKFVCKQRPADEKDKARLLAQYIAFGLKNGANCIDAIEGAMSTIRAEAAK